MSEVSRAEGRTPKMPSSEPVVGTTALQLLSTALVQPQLREEMLGTYLALEGGS